MSDESWVDADGARAYLAQLKGQLKAQIELLIADAKASNDPQIRADWTAIAVFQRIIAEMEAERAKPADQ